MFDINVWTVLLAAGITAVTTGAGAFPFLFVKDVTRWWVGISNAIAAGLMLSASHGLMVEGSQQGFTRTLAGILLGLALLLLAKKAIRNRGDFDVAELEGTNARKALLILGVMTAHSFAEGVGVGVSYGSGEELGVFITLAIAVHNIPEGLAISLVLIPRGTPLWKASLWSIFTSLPQPIMAVPAFLFVLTFKPILPVGLGFAAGAMIWMVFAELIPDTFKDTSPTAVGTAVTLSFTLMQAFQHFLLTG